MQSDGAVWRFPINRYNRASDEENWPTETGVKGAAFCSTRSDELDRIEEVLYPVVSLASNTPHHTYCSQQMYLPEGKGPRLTKGEIRDLSNSVCLLG